MPTNPHHNVPGLALPLDAYKDAILLHPFHEEPEWKTSQTCTTEAHMLRFINAVTDEPGWEDGVDDPAVIARWRKRVPRRRAPAEENESEEEYDDEDDEDPQVAQTLHRYPTRSRNPLDTDLPTPKRKERQVDRRTDKDRYVEDPIAAYLAVPHRGGVADYPFSNNHRFDVYLKEQDFKYCLHELRDKAKVFKNFPAVSVLDTAGAVIKTDAVPASLAKALRDAAALHDEAGEWRDDDVRSVRNVIDPTLYTFVYGRTPVVDEPLSLETCLQAVGAGTVVPRPEAPQINITGGGRCGRRFLGLGRRIVRHEINWRFSSRYQRLPTDVAVRNGKAHFTSYINNVNPREDKLYAVLEDILTEALPLLSTTYYRAREWLAGGCPNRSRCELSHWRSYPPCYLRVNAYSYLGCTDFTPRGPFLNGKLQVIVSMTSIHLTPENPSHPGGDWHVEGLLSDHIAAVATYYYDEDNITPSTIHFGSADGTMTILGAVAKTVIGAVATSKGRMLAWPNVFYHRVSPFELKDSTKPGYRKVLAFFLIDPASPVLSTSFVPPQQARWSDIKVPLPRELRELVTSHLDMPYDIAEARRVRTEYLADEEHKRLMLQNSYFHTGRLRD